MALPSTGSLSMSQIAVELGLSATTNLSLNDARVRTLANKSTGVISFADLRGKSAVTVIDITSGLTDANLYELAGSPSKAGKFEFNLYAGISASTLTYALRTGVFPTGSEVLLNVMAAVIGKSGDGGSFDTAGGPGGGGLWVEYPISINNTSTIAGGGGGGGGIQSKNNILSIVMSAAGGSGQGSGASTIKTNVTNASTEVSTPPTLGNTAAAGSGGYVKEISYDHSIEQALTGGSGGTLGQSGGAVNYHNYGSTASKDVITSSAAGAGGFSVSGNNRVTWINTGTLLGNLIP